MAKPQPPHYVRCALAVLVVGLAGLLSSALGGARADDAALADRIGEYGPDHHVLVDALIANRAPRPTQPGAPRLSLIAGASRPHPQSVPDTPGPFTHAFVHDKALVIEAANLRNDRRYTLQFTCWDGDAPERKLSVHILDPGSKLAAWRILPPTVCSAWHADKATSMRVALPLPPAGGPKSHFYITFKREAGPNVAVSEIRLWESTASLPEDDANRRRRLLIVTGDDYPGHRWRETAPALAAIVRADPRMEVTICETPMILASPLLDSPRTGYYDAVILHYVNWAGPDPGDAVHRGLARFVEDGGGLVVVHFGCGAFREWDAYGDVVGRVWDPALRGHDPYGRFTVRITDPTHPITRALADFDTTDELYTCLTGEADIHIVAAATSKVDQRDYPMAFTRAYHQGRVLHCTLGHDLNAFQSPGTQALYRRAAAWAANLSPDPDPAGQTDSGAKQP